MAAALRCVRPQFQWYQLAYATEMKSIQLHDSIEGLSQKIVFITLHYITLASYSSQNKFQDCYHRFQGIAFPAAILSCCPCPTVCAHAITAIFLFLVNKHSLTKNRNGKVQVVLIRCLGHLEWVAIHLSSISALPAFRKRLKHHLFSSAFPGISTPSTDITLCDVITSTNVNHARCTLLPS